VINQRAWFFSYGIQMPSNMPKIPEQRLFELEQDEQNRL